MERRKKGLYNIFFDRLREAGVASRREIIPFPVVFEKLCRNFSISKQECWDILFLLRDFELITIVPFHGVKIR